MDEPINAHQDTSPTAEIFKVVDPVAVFVGLLNAHAVIVAQRLRGPWLGVGDVERCGSAAGSGRRPLVDCRLQPLVRPTHAAAYAIIESLAAKLVEAFGVLITDTACQIRRQMG